MPDLRETIPIPRFVVRIVGYALVLLAAGAVATVVVVMIALGMVANRTGGVGQKIDAIQTDVQKIRKAVKRQVQTGRQPEDEE